MTSTIMKVFSVLLFFVFVWGNMAFFNNNSFHTLHECLLQSSGLEGMNRLSPDRYEQFSEGHYGLKDRDTVEGMAPIPSAEVPNCFLSGAIGGDLVDFGSPDIDKDGTLTAQEVYVYESTRQTASMVDVLIINLYPILSALLVLADSLAVGFMLSVWLPRKKQ